MKCYLKFKTQERKDIHTKNQWWAIKLSYKNSVCMLENVLKDGGPEGGRRERCDDL